MDPQPRSQTSSYVSGYPNSCYKKYSTKEKALSAYKSAWDRGEVQGKVYHPAVRVAP
jgi:viroplasmin and RNaseH domain-containing protein